MMQVVSKRQSRPRDCLHLLSVCFTVCGLAGMPPLSVRCVEPTEGENGTRHCCCWITFFTLNNWTLVACDAAYHILTAAVVII